MVQAADVPYEQGSRLGHRRRVEGRAEGRVLAPGLRGEIQQHSKNQTRTAKGGDSTQRPVHNDKGLRSYASPGDVLRGQLGALKAECVNLYLIYELSDIRTV